jgi:microcystin-dependent protein
MSTPYLAEVKIISWNYPPKGWAFCNGQLLPINQNQALFSLLGTTYGGDGRTTFALPDLRGRIPFHVGSGIALGDRSGESAHTLTISETPAHTHVPVGNSTIGSTIDPTGNVWAANAFSSYGSAANATMNPAAILSAGGSQAHDNLPPYLVLNFIIALQGIFPSRN